jgi:acyl transferase domain-containing protein
MSKVVWMFSGQGSQYFDMGRDLFESDSEFRDSMLSCNTQCERLGFSLAEIVYPKQKKPLSELFDNVLHTHPALLCVQYSLAQTLLRRGMKPDLVLGYSLGEMAALTVAGALPLTAALESLVSHSQMIVRSTFPGAMMAVMAPAGIVDSSPVYRGTTIAAHNFANHFVLAGLRDPMGRVEAHLRAAEIAHQRLPVNFAFHSPCMDPLAAYFKNEASRLRPRALAFPLVSLAYGETMEAVPDEFFWNVLRHPVRFDEGIRKLEAAGDYRYVDLGPSGTLATFLKYVLKPDSRSAVYPILTPFRQAVVNLGKLEQDL